MKVRGIKTHLVLHAAGEPDSGWCLGDLTENELECMIYEVSRYNKWIRLLHAGEAPLKSYRDETIAAQFIRTQNHGLYNEETDFSALKWIGGRYATDLVLISESGRVPPFFFAAVDGLLSKRRHLESIVLAKIEYNEQPLGTLQDFLCDPLVLEGSLSLGYKPFPLTDRIISRWNKAREKEIANDEKIKKK